MNIIFEDKISKDSNGDYRFGNRNHTQQIKVYKNAPDKLKTLIHELIHSFFDDEIRRGNHSRVINKLNNNNKFVDGLSVRIKEGIISTIKR